MRIPNFIINLQTEVYQAAHLCFLFCCGTTGPIHQNVGLASSMLFSPCAKFWACFFVTWGIALSLRQTGKREKAKVIEPLRAEALRLKFFWVKFPLHSIMSSLSDKSEHHVIHVFEALYNMDTNGNQKIQRVGPVETNMLSISVALLHCRQFEVYYYYRCNNYVGK